MILVRNRMPKMNDLMQNRGRLSLMAAYVLLLAGAAVQLHLQGRTWWCACGGFSLCAWDIWSSHNSQHLFDPYSFTHILHGVVFCGMIFLIFPKLSLGWRLWMAILAECLWEILENSRFVIDRYREATIALGYEGDSIVNSLGDIGCCAVGFILAWRLGFRKSLVFFIVTELVLLLWMRDNLTLNVLMLLCPIDAVKQWQMR